MKFKSIISIVKTSFAHWQSHRASRMGAALSYYAVFSIVPLLMLVLFVIGPVLGNEYIQNEIIRQVNSIANTKSANFIQSILIGFGKIKYNLPTILVGISTLVFGALGVFYELKNSLDDLWDTDETTKEVKSWKYFFSSRILSLSMIPILGFLLIMSLVFSGLISLISGYLPIFAEMTFLLQIGSSIFSFFILTFLFSFIYRFLPKRKLPWRELFRGAVITTSLFMIGNYFINLYITEFSGASIFGATEAFIVLLLWVYYSVQIFLFGASLTYVYSRRYGHLKKG